LNSTGPRLSSLMAMAVSSMTGDTASNSRPPTIRSNSHFITTSQSVIGLSMMSRTGTPPM
jgi:hypothetical protein